MSEEINNNELKSETSDLKVEELNTRKLQAYAVIALGLVFLALIAFWFFKNDKKEITQDSSSKIGTQVKKANFNFREDNQPNKPEEKTFKELALNEPDLIPPTFEAPDKENPFVAKVNNVQLKVLKGSSETMVGSNMKDVSSDKLKTAPSSLVSNERYIIDANGNVVDTQKSVLEADTDTSFAGETFTPTTAKKGEFNPNLLLSKGSYIGCSLDTRLVSSIKGGVTCTVSDNVYSTNGATLLIEKGSKITGFFKSGQMNDGVNRIFVVWQEIRTPNYINIPVYSGASDELGGSGIEGWVDHHWLERFGAAILLSVIDDALNVSINGKRGHGNIDYTENSRETTRSMADTALQKFINIEPTLYKNHGDIVGVYVNRDIDFSKVYKLNLKNKHARKYISK